MSCNEFSKEAEEYQNRMREKDKRFETAAIKMIDSNMLPKELRLLLEQTILTQFNCEWWGGVNYFECVHLAPSKDEKMYMRMLGREELGHAHILAEGPLATLDKNPYCQLAKTAKDQRDILKIFRYPEEFESWEDVIAFNVVQDGGADIQLERFMRGPYAPWNEAISKMEAEEVEHREHGEQWVRALSSFASPRERLDRAFVRWLPRALRAFGGPDATSKTLPLYRKYNLKDSNDAQRKELIRRILPSLHLCGFDSLLLKNPELCWSSEFQ